MPDVQAEAQEVPVAQPSETRRAFRSLLTERLRVILDERPVRVGVISAMLVMASLVNLMPGPAGVDSGWLFIVPVCISAIAGGLSEGLFVAFGASLLCSLYAGAETPGFSTSVAFSAFSARFALYGITSMVVGAFAEAHYSVQSRLRELATLDPLTKVFNIAGFYKEMGVLEDSPTDFAVMLLDLDNLKKINDTYGHQTGTESIQLVANILRRVVRGSDCLARYGGDEFVIILREANLAGSQIVANRIREILIDERPASAPDLQLTVSIGVSLYGEDGKSAEELLEAADMRMYRDKQTRKLARKRTESENWGLSNTV
jgi:diguanylate cyclase (GGDEF)-like protein